MKRKIINPWTWQEKLGFVHGNKISKFEKILFVAGQTASDAKGQCLFPGDMSAQIEQTIKNIEAVLDEGGMDFTNVMRLNVYVTDMQLMLQAHDHMVKLLQSRGCQHVGTLLGISALASPGALVEMEVTAAK